MHQDTSLLESVADKHRDNTLTMLSRDLFNRQEHLFSKLGKYYEWTKAQAKEYRRKANTTARLDHTPEIVRDSLPEHELNEQWLLLHYGLAVRLHAHLASIMESVDEQGCGYFIAPYAKLNFLKNFSHEFNLFVEAVCEALADVKQTKMGNTSGAP
jgi:hypothetical protein